MNINTGYTNLNNVSSYNRKPSSLGLNVKNAEEKTVESKASFTPQDAVIVETSSSNFYSTDEELFELLNRNKTWQIDGEDVAFDDLDKDTKAFLQKLSSVHNDYIKSNDDIDFGELTVSLGNKYASLRDELAEKYSGDELNSKLESLEKAFNMYSETKVVGNVYETGSMANRAYFSLVKAKADKYMKEKREAYLEGKDPTSVKNNDLTDDDKETLNNLLSNAKNALTNVTEFFNKNGVIKNETELVNLYDFIGENNLEHSWSLGKLSATFELLENVKGSNEERYSKEEFSKVVESEDFKTMFSEKEQNLFKDIYNIYS